MTSRIGRLSVALGLLFAAAASPLGAQLIRVPSPDAARRPVTLTAGAGFLQTQGRFDGQSGAYWSLGESFQYRVSLDVGLRSGALGLTGALASVPIRRNGDPSTDGHIQFRQLMATFRSPDGQSFFQLLEVSGGLGQWASYSGPDVLSADEAKTRNAVALVIGYGFGFALGERMVFTVVQDAGTVIGSSEGLPAGERRSQQQFTTRIGLRYRILGAR